MKSPVGEDGREGLPGVEGLPGATLTPEERAEIMSMVEAFDPTNIEFRPCGWWMRLWIRIRGRRTVHEDGVVQYRLKNMIYFPQSWP